MPLLRRQMAGKRSGGARSACQGFRKKTASLLWREAVFFSLLFFVGQSDGRLCNRTGGTVEVKGCRRQRCCTTLLCIAH